MTSREYEELCRRFIADVFQLPLDRVGPREFVNPQRPGAPEYNHQIDLYWEIETRGARYIHIANAKWRRPEDKVQLGDVELLQQIRNKVAAHKAFLITNTGYRDGALAAAIDNGIGLYIVQPRGAGCQPAALSGSAASRPADDSQAAGPHPASYSFEIIHKGIDLTRTERKAMTLSNPALAAVFSAGSKAAAKTPLSYPTKQGPGPGRRTK
jgi:hypothetical protein